jgi:MarR family transcriptional regulator, organic hydroperoxide resistance regulator
MSNINELFGAIEKWAGIYFFRSLSEYFEYLKENNISMQQAYALTFVFYNSPCKISDICEHMMVSAPAVSQMVDRLEKINLVERISDEHDRRVRNVVLSKKGRLLIDESITARQSWLKSIPLEFNEHQTNQIIESLNMLTDIYIN